MKNQILTGDCLASLKTLPAQSVHCCVTSPPYWGLRDYGCEGQIGLEPTPDAFVSRMVIVFREVWRVLRDDGTLWMNMGDSYSAPNGRSGGGTYSRGPNSQLSHMHDGQEIGVERTFGNTKPKDLVGIPWRLAFALQADGWYLRSDIIWHKPNPMPESVIDRPTKSHEYIFLLTKSQRYYFDQEAVRLPPSGISGGAVFGGMKKGLMLRESGIRRDGRYCEQADRDRYMTTGANIRTVWSISTQNFPGAHFATFPEKLVEPCILAGTSERGCCPECGAPWTRIVKKSGGTTGKGWHDHKDDLALGQRGGNNGNDAAAGWGKDYKVESLGWQPGCQCGHEPIPCTVLDPFFGAGTTGLVAAKLGRYYVGCELNPEYAAMAEARIRNRNSVGPVIEPLPGQRELFNH